MIYPWQTNIWNHVTAMRGRLPHALLLHGRQGIGKRDFALSWSQSLLCERLQDNGQACEVCASCNWFLQHNHPDYRLLTPEQDAAADDEPAVASKTGKKSQISIAQVRALSDFLELTSHRDGGLRIAVIHPAEALNAASANALLKMLEEPPPSVVFILVSNQPQKLLPTILSRCRKITMPVPEKSLALQWLEQKGMKDANDFLGYASGSPLIALANAEEQGSAWKEVIEMLARGNRLDPYNAARVLVAQGMETAIAMLQKWIYDLIACHLTGAIRYHERQVAALQALSKSVDLGVVLDFQRKLDEARKSATHPLNHELQLESLLLQYTQIFSRPAAP